MRTERITGRRSLRSESIKNKNKKKLPENSSIKDFFYMIILYILKKCVYTPTYIKIGIYMSALLVFSLLKDFQLVPITYFSSKSNIFNQYFVKIGWGWTLAVSVPFIAMTSCVYTAGNRYAVCMHLMRTAIATAIWFIFTSIFEYIDVNTGRCSSKDFGSKYLCKSNKYDWVASFDISGHTFILMHSLFYLLEEIKIFYVWENIKNEIGKDDQELSERSKRVKVWYNKLTPFIKINFILVSLLTLVWEIMLMATFLYFHTILHKIIAAFFAIICWFLTYKTFYLLPSSPGLPGRGSEIILNKK
jgi:hypothetical protein